MEPEIEREEIFDDQAPEKKAWVQRFFERVTNSSIGRDAIGSFGLKVTYTGLSFIGAALLARLLGPSGYGVYAYAYAMVSLLSIPSQFGLPNLVVRETARGMAQGDFSAVQGIWRWAGRMVGQISFALVALAALAAWFFRGTLDAERLATYTWALALVPLVALGNLRGAALRGLHRVVAGQLPEFLLQPGLLSLFLVIAAVMSDSLIPASKAMALNAGAAALSFGVGAFLLWRVTPSDVQKASPRYENRAWLNSTLPLALIGGLRLANRQAAIIILGFFVADADIGIYRVAAQVSLLTSFGLDAINMVAAPRFAALYARTEMVKLQRLVTISNRVILAFNFTLTAGFVVFGKMFLNLAFGQPYVAAYIPLMVLLVGQLVNSATGSVGVLLNMTHKEREAAKGIAFAFVVNVTLNFLLIPAWGIIGSAVANAIAMIIWNVLLWLAVRKHLGINSLAIKIPGLEMPGHE